jgi:hypothetical protein
MEWQVPQNSGVSIYMAPSLTGSAATIIARTDSETVRPFIPRLPIKKVLRLSIIAMMPYLNLMLLDRILGIALPHLVREKSSSLVAGNLVSAGLFFLRRYI